MSLVEKLTSEDPQDVVSEQANDEALWFVPETTAEDYLQKALRRLHCAIEDNS